MVATPRTLLAIPGPRAARRVLEFYLDNRAHLEPWEPPRSVDFYTEAYWAERLEKNQHDAAEDRSLRMVMFDTAEGLGGRVIGGVSFTSIVRGPLQSCFLGYNLAARKQGQGVAREAVAAAIDTAWDRLGLHRIEASYVPTNERSGRLLRRLGFSVEGYSRDYLFVGERWNDHVRTALINPRFPERWNELSSPK